LRTRARRGRRGRRRETACRGGGHRGRGHGPEFGAAVGRRRTAPAAGASRRRVRGGSGDGGRGHRTRSRSGLPASDRQHTARLTTGVSVASKLGPLAVIVGHELRSRLRDGTALLVAFVAPVVLATLFGVALGGDEAPLRTTIGVVDDDGGDFPASVQREAMETEELREVLEFRQFPDEAVAQDALDAGEIGAAIVFPAVFSDSVSAGEGG